MGAYRGSSAIKVDELTGISDLQRLMQNRRILWAASVYRRHLPELKEEAEQILRGVLGEDAELRWTSGDAPAGRKVRVEELDDDAVEKWSDDSRMDGRATGATRNEGEYQEPWLQ